MGAEHFTRIAARIFKINLTVFFHACIIQSKVRFLQVERRPKKLNGKLKEKIRESVQAVLPITAIVLILHLTIAPMEMGMLRMFALGAVLLVTGMGLFTLGADMAMMPMGELTGARLTRSRSLPLLTLTCFIMGFIITMAEPDLQVLASQVPAVPDLTLILAVALGVGVFLVLAILRIVFQKKLNVLLIVFYGVLFLLAAFTSRDFLPVAFDSGGVTTGPITVPFIMALGVGVATVRGGRNVSEDSFGLVALCSIGPVLAVLVLGMFFDPSSGAYAAEITPMPRNGYEVFQIFRMGFRECTLEVALALSPIVLFFIVFQLFFLKLPARRLIKLMVGLVYTVAGLVLFLTGVNVGFMPAGNYIGQVIGGLEFNWILIPIGMIIGYYIVSAEPAVHVLNTQVEEITDGAITRHAMMYTLSIGMAISLGLAMTRVLTGISIWYFLLPGYALALGLSFFVPPVFTAVAFDSGGVASGPMTATFLLPFAMGACTAVGGNMLTDAFGIVAMVAMTPLIAVQLMGLVYALRQKRQGGALATVPEEDSEIIEL